MHNLSASSQFTRYQQPILRGSCLLIVPAIANASIEKPYVENIVNKLVNSSVFTEIIFELNLREHLASGLMSHKEYIDNMLKYDARCAYVDYPFDVATNACILSLQQHGARIDYMSLYERSVSYAA